MRILFVPCLFLSFIPGSVGYAQGESALPFLLIHPSPDANGWGNVSTAVASDNPIAGIANPGQLGLFGLNNMFSAGTYAGKTQWLPRFGQSDLTYNVWGLNAGYELGSILGLDFPLSFSAGYSRVDLNLGRFIITGPSGPEPIGTYEAKESSERITLGLGLDYFVQIGVGLSLDRHRSSLGPVSAQISTMRDLKVSTHGFGLMLRAPIMDILEKLERDRVTIVDDLAPLMAISAGYARTNLGKDLVTYHFEDAPDPLPRNVTIGMSAEFGVTTSSGSQRWKLVAFTIAREAEDLLVVRRRDGSFEYQPGLGDISFFKHVVRGSLASDERPNLHKGWQLNLAETVYIRGGSFTESPNFGGRNYATNGIGIHSSGFLKMIDALNPGILTGGVAAFIRDHVNLVYDRANYDAIHSPIHDTTFHGVSLVIR